MRIGEQIILDEKIMNCIINEDAVFSDETKNYLFPFEPDESDEVKVRIRIGSGECDGVYFCSEDMRIKMTLEKSKEIFDYYYVVIPPEEKDRKYHFEIEAGSEIYFYNAEGLRKQHNEFFDFTINRHYKTPDWAKGAVGYQIFVDRFFNGDKTNDVVNDEYEYLGKKVRHIDEWDALPQESDICNFYGGDLQGVMDKLDYLHDLGIEMIYLNPIFVSPSNHKYDCQDYEHIDPHFGKIIADSDEDKYIVRTTDRHNLEAGDYLFAELVEQAHKRGIKVIIDGVFNHCGSFNKWLDAEKIYEKAEGYETGAYISEDSPYHDFFKWNGGCWPDNDCYDSWWGHKNHPKLNYEQSEKLFQYIMDIAEKWISPPFNADGWRIDVAADLGFSKEYNHKFWKEFRKKVKSANPEAVIIAEHYGSAADWLKGDQWDSVMNYDAFMEPVSWFFTGMEKHSDGFDGGKFRNAKAFEYSMTANSRDMGIHALFTGMNELSNHDHSRFLTRTNMRVGRLATAGSQAADENVNKAVMMNAAAFQFIWPGIPTLYYGDEAGVTGWTDPDNRRTYPWGKEDEELISFHKKMIELRKKYRVLKEGSFKFIYADDGVAAVARFDDDERIISVFNSTDERKTIVLSLWPAGGNIKGEAVTLLKSGTNGYKTGGKIYAINNGCINISIEPCGCAILKSE